MRLSITWFFKLSPRDRTWHLCTCRILYRNKYLYDDAIKWQHFLRYWPFVREIHRWIPLTKATDTELWCFFDLRLNKRLSKQSWPVIWAIALIMTSLMMCGVQTLPFSVSFRFVFTMENPKWHSQFTYISHHLEISDNSNPTHERYPRLNYLIVISVIVDSDI